MRYSESHHQGHPEGWITASTDGQNDDWVGPQSILHLSQRVKSDCLFSSANVDSVIGWVEEGSFSVLKVQAIHKVDTLMEVNDRGTYDMNFSIVGAFDRNFDNAKAFGLLAPHSSNNTLRSSHPRPVLGNQMRSD